MAVVGGLKVHQRAWRYGLIWVVVLSVGVGCSAHLAYAATRDVHMAVEHGKITATLEQAPLQAVLDKLQQLTGIRYVLPSAEAERTISVRVRAVPLVEALREMFAPLSYAVQTDADGNLLYVGILGRYDAASQAAMHPPSPGTLEPMPMTLARGETMPMILPRTAEPMPMTLASGEPMPITFLRDPAPMPIEPARESMEMYISR